MNKVLFRDLPENGTIETYVLLKDAQEKSSKNGSIYLCLSLFDGKTEIKANMWQTTKATFGFDTSNVIVYVQLETSPYNGKPSYTVKKIREADSSDDISKSDFIPTTSEKPEDLYSKCLDLAYSLSDDDLMRLVTTMYEKYKEQILHWGAGKSMHHNIVGGWLWHSYRMACTVNDYTAHYPAIKRDIAVAGALLHDIGKLLELDTDEFGASEYTVDGSLFGHLMIGVSMVKENGEALGVNDTTLKQLLHIIASHHGKQEFGAISLPATPEAFAVYMADILDSRMYVFEKCLDEMQPGEFSERQTMLDGARVYKF
jgi:3'-5' exoribonuclease